MDALPPQRLGEVIAAAVARQTSRTSAQLETLAPQESLQLPRQALNLLAQLHDEPYRLQIPFWSGDSLATAFPEVEANGRVEILSHLTSRKKSHLKSTRPSRKSSSSSTG